jgi:hypothetical protein
MSQLDQLAQHHEAILLAELAGLLHNIGKLNPNFLKSIVSDESNAVVLLKQHNQFVDGYASKRFARPSEDILNTSFKTPLANDAPVDISQLPGHPPGNDLEKAQQKAATAFNRFYRGVGPLSEQQRASFAPLILEVSGEKWRLTDLLTLFWDEFFHKPNNDDYQRTYALDRWLGDQPNSLPHLLIHAHGEISGSEKFQIIEDEGTGAITVSGVSQQKPAFGSLRIARAFGYETEVAVWDLLPQQQRLINQAPTLSLVDEEWRLQFQRILRQGLGDTQRPINEITLWDYAASIAALFKTSIAKSFLEGQVTNANQMHWRLLGVRFDGLDYILQANRVADLIGRQQKYQEMLNQVNLALSQETPIASQVYQDENGLFFIVPDSDRLQLADLRTLIEKHLQRSNFTELRPHTDWSKEKLRGKQLNLGWELKRLDEAKRPAIHPELVEKWWRNQSSQICEVCGLRPAISRETKYCAICKDTRHGRVQVWLNDRTTTIWLDEVADSHGRLTLITGQFPLNNWLDGTLVKSLALGMDETTGQPVSKFATFPRVQRIWQTTQTFWQEVQANTNQTLSDARRRLTIQLANQPNLTQYQVYELDLHGRSRMSVIWDGQHLISTDNLSYTTVQLGIKPEDRQTPADAALAVGTWLEDNKHKSFSLISDDEKNKRVDIQIADIDYQNAAYATAIPILTEPRTFMTLVPADQALAIVAAIKIRYEREMGKVRNRLPLHLGLVYFHRRTPLRAALDAGRRMLKYELGTAQDEVWRVTEKVQGPLPDGKIHLAEKENGQFAQTVTVKLERNRRSLTWHVPAKMGDGQTDDNWYPYVFIKSDVNGRSPAFKGIRPTSDNKSEECWLLHASQLQKDDQIYFTPATLDFQWLDSTARRFEIDYGENGRRRDHLTRPYLLDEHDEIEAAWTMLRTLSKNQLYTLRDTVEEKRAAWFVEPHESLKDDTFKQFCADIIRNTKWKTAVDTTKLTNWAINGLLADAIQLHVSIMKDKLQPSSREEHTNE